MNEAEWLASDDAGKLVRFLASPKHRRRLRLLSCGVCRYYQMLSPHERVRQALDCAEEVADGRLRESTLAGWQRMLLKRLRESARPIDQAIYAAVEHACLPPSSFGYCQDSWGHLTAYFRFHRKEEVRAVEIEQVALTLVRDIFGNPFRPVAIDPRWLAFQDGLVVRLAQSAYDERDPSNGTLDPARLAILADALEEAGCTNEEILNHCRQPGVHVRGCWPVDRILEKS